MKKKNLIIVILGFLILYLIIQQWFLNSYDGSTFSNSKADSIRDGYFDFQYSSKKDSVKLKNGSKIKSPNVWIESAQKTSHKFLFIPTKEKSHGYNLIINSHFSCSSNDLHFSINKDYHILNCIDTLGWVYLKEYNDNKFTLYISQPDDNIGWQKPIVVDSIEYAAPKEKINENEIEKILGK